MATAQFQISLRDYLQILFHRKWVILGVLVLTLGGSFWYAWRTPRIYRASNEVRVVSPYDTNPNLQGIVKRTTFQQRLTVMMRVIQNRNDGLPKLLGGVDGLAAMVPDIAVFQKARKLMLEQRLADAEAGRRRYANRLAWPVDELEAEKASIRRKLAETDQRLETGRALREELLALETALERSREENGSMSTEDLRRLVHLREVFSEQEQRAAILMAQCVTLMNVTRPSNEYLSVSFESTSPEVAAQAVDQVLDMLEELNSRLQEEEVDTSVDVLREKVGTLEREVTDKKRELEGYAALDPLVFRPLAPDDNLDQVRFIPDNKDATLQEYSDLQHRLSEVVTELAETERVIAQLARSLRGESPVLVTEERSSGMDGLAGIRAQLSLEEARLAGLIATRSDLHPLVVESRNKIQAYRRTLEQGGPTVVVSQVESPNPVYQRIREDLERARTRSEGLEGRRRELIHLSEISFEKLKSYPKRQLEILQLQLDYRQAQQALDLFRNKLQDAHITRELDVQKNSTRLERRETTQVPLRPIRPNVVLILLIGLVTGVFGSGAMVFAVEYADHSIRGIVDARRHVDLPLLGAISEYELQQEEIRRMLGLRGAVIWARQNRGKLVVAGLVLVLVLLGLAWWERISLYVKVHGMLTAPTSAALEGRGAAGWLDRRPGLDLGSQPAAGGGEASPPAREPDEPSRSETREDGGAQPPRTSPGPLPSRR